MSNPRPKLAFLRRAVALALAAEREGNIPVGAVIVLDDEVVGEGQSRLLEPHYHPGRHAEVEALRDVDPALWPRAREMTCYSTLEPCVMCAGSLLLHGVGRVVFGARDHLGGARSILRHLPPYYDRGGVYDWIGPAMPKVCDPLYERADAMFASLPVGRDSWTAAPEPAEDLLAAFPQDPSREWIRDLRETLTAVIDTETGELLEDAIARAQDLFEHTGALKDYRLLKKLADRADRPRALVDVADSVRRSLPDVWIHAALKRGDTEGAISAWWEAEDHRRARLCANELAARCARNDPELWISCKMTVVSHAIRKGTRRHYRRACGELRLLRDQLFAMGADDYWPLVLDDVQSSNERRPAFLDELAKARL